MSYFVCVSTTDGKSMKTSVSKLLRFFIVSWGRKARGSTKNDEYNKKRSAC